MRENKRYLLLEGKELKKNLEQAILDFIGTKGYAETGLQVIEIQNASGIIAINREKLEDVKAAFALSLERIIVKKVSGTLKGLRGKV